MTSPAVRTIRISCAVIFVLGIAGMIISSIAGNNVGVVTTIGVTTAIAALALLIASVSSSPVRLDHLTRPMHKFLNDKLLNLLSQVPTKLRFAQLFEMRQNLVVILD